jgi:hypothetical protein
VIVRFDLHLHTDLSDGFEQPESLARAAVAGRLDTIAITDHDDCRAAERARAAITDGELRVLNGVEISAICGTRPLHILGYGFDPQNRALVDALRVNRAAKRAQVAAMIEALRNMGVHLELEALTTGRDPDAYLGREHLARHLVARKVCRPSTVYRRYLGRGRPGYVSARILQAGAAISLLQDAGGVALLAHPSNDDLEKSLPELCDHGLDGLELFRPRRSTEQLEAIAKAAQARGLLVSGGSDWHGRPSEASLGRFSCSSEQLRPLLERLQLEEAA